MRKRVAKRIVQRGTGDPHRYWRAWWVLARRMQRNGRCFACVTGQNRGPDLKGLHTCG